MKHLKKSKDFQNDIKLGKKTGSLAGHLHLKYQQWKVPPKQMAED
jgi:hypothetical protein